MDVTSAINRIQTLWLEVPGVRAAPNEPVERIDPYPMAITYEASGEIDPSQMYSHVWAPQKGTIVSLLLVVRKDMPLDVRKVMTFRNAFLRKVQGDPDLNDFLMMVNRLTWTVGPLEWEGILHIGYRFVFEFSSELEPS